MKPAATSVPFAGPFALGTLSAPDGVPFPALVTPDGRALDLRAAFGERELTTRTLLESWAEATPRLYALARDDKAAWQPLGDLRAHAPVEPGQVFQSGANYRQHVIDLEVAHRAPDDPRTVEEAREEIAAVMDRRAAEDLPYVFIGLPSAITGPYDDVPLPDWAEKPDWELELAAVIGKPAYRVSTDEALEYVMRLHHRQRPHRPGHRLPPGHARHRHGLAAQQERPRFHPLGPWIVPAESIVDPGDLRVTLRLNGDTMQDESTKDMLFSVARLVSYISRTSRLLPGDLVLTGSPAGNGIHWGRLLRDGDVMDGSITGLGAQRTRCIGETAS